MLKTLGYHSAITGRDPTASASLETSIPAVSGVKGVKPHDRNWGIRSSRVHHTCAPACTHREEQRYRGSLRNTT